jgi:hypothetical protein
LIKVKIIYISGRTAIANLPFNNFRDAANSMLKGTWTVHDDGAVNVSQIESLEQIK